LCSLFSVTCGHYLKGKIEKINVALKEDSKIRNSLVYWARMAELENHNEKLKKKLNKTSLYRLILKIFFSIMTKFYKLYVIRYKNTLSPYFLEYMFLL
jgi:hypothetical protein